MGIGADSGMGIGAGSGMGIGASGGMGVGLGVGSSCPIAGILNISHANANAASSTVDPTGRTIRNAREETV